MNCWHLSAPKVGALGERSRLCPSFGALRMVESAELLVEEVFPKVPTLVGAELSFPVALFAGPLPGADGQGPEHRLPHTLNQSD